ncbi:hypothetical protein [Jeotgalibacillus proteolyticus]|nr:hypothetical protein [Jeotgalibacillus proteolyticus]
MSRLLLEALLKQQKEEAYQLYLALRPNMTEENYQTFDEFYEPLINNEEVENKTSGEILSEVKDLLNSHTWR